jgi:SAM-dependent methyltransferase
MASPHATFDGSIPEYYDSCLGPAWFDGMGKELAGLLPANPGGALLEIACGTGLVTRRLRQRLDPSLRMVASDFSKAMLDYARDKLGDVDGIEWREADAAKLPFGDREFGAVACSFGVMFVPDRKAVFSEARRVLKDGGTFIFSVWDRIENNPCARVLAEVVEGLFPDDPEMRFRLPWEMYDVAQLRKLLADARFEVVRIEMKRLPIENVSARTVATGGLRGTPRVHLLTKHGIAVGEVIDRATAALEKMGGADVFRAHCQAILVEARAA